MRSASVAVTVSRCRPQPRRFQSSSCSGASLDWGTPLFPVYASLTAHVSSTPTIPACCSCHNASRRCRLLWQSHLIQNGGGAGIVEVLHRLRQHFMAVRWTLEIKTDSHVVGLSQTAHDLSSDYRPLSLQQCCTRTAAVLQRSLTHRLLPSRGTALCRRLERLPVARTGSPASAGQRSGRPVPAAARTRRTAAGSRASTPTSPPCTWIRHRFRHSTKLGVFQTLYAAQLFTQVDECPQPVGHPLACSAPCRSHAKVLRTLTIG